MEINHCSITYLLSNVKPSFCKRVTTPMTVYQSDCDPADGEPLGMSLDSLSRRQSDATAARNGRVVLAAGRVF